MELRQLENFIVWPSAFIFCQFAVLLYIIECKYELKA